MVNRLKVLVEIQNITDENQVVAGATVNNNGSSFQQREEIIPKEKSIVTVGDSVV